ncbi:cupin domain-containing protein [Balneola sp. MJW-20]|uniref:cupin domain-containing protein n=1 Tax=Gracilimonas aurantiaca TaxID=3234185 RepID=UPI003466606E
MSLSLFLMLFVYNIAYAQSPKIEKALTEVTRSYANDAMALSGTFGIEVDNQWWHVHVQRKQDPYQVGKSKQYTFHNFGPHEVTLHEGKPEEPTWYFDFASEEVFNKIYSGEWTAATASAKSMPGDVVGLNIRPMEKFKLDQQYDGISYQVMEHFWKHETVEIARFERDRTLATHGADHVGLYTMKDKRIGWFTLGKDEAANEDPRLQYGQVPNLFIFTKGKGVAYFGEEKIEVEAGMSVFIAPYMKHMISNPNEEPLEGIVILFGDNIDYATGQSYPDYLDVHYQNLGDNDLRVRAIASGN